MDKLDGMFILCCRYDMMNRRLIIMLYVRGLLPIDMWLMMHLLLSGIFSVFYVNIDMNSLTLLLLLTRRG